LEDEASPFDSETESGKIRAKKPTLSRRMKPAQRHSTVKLKAVRFERQNLRWRVKPTHSTMGRRRTLFFCPSKLPTTDLKGSTKDPFFFFCPSSLPTTDLKGPTKDPFFLPTFADHRSQRAHEGPFFYQPLPTTDLKGPMKDPFFCQPLPTTDLKGPMKDPFLLPTFADPRSQRAHGGPFFFANLCQPPISKGP